MIHYVAFVANVTRKIIPFLGISIFRQQKKLPPVSQLKAVKIKRVYEFITDSLQNQVKDVKGVLR